MTKPVPLNRELDELFRFMVEPDLFESSGSIIRPISARSYIESIKRFLGWMYRFRVPTIPLEDLHLQVIIPSSGLVNGTPQDTKAVRAILRDVVAYLAWHRRRGTATRSVILFVQACLWVAKFLYGDQSSTPIFFESSSKRTIGYQDIPVIVALRDLLVDKNQETKLEPPVADQSKKWLDWRDFLEVVEQLGQNCSPIGSNGCKRSPSAIAAARQRFLIVGLLSGFPDRQRTFRELSVGRTLFNRNGIWQVEHEAKDLKVAAFAKDGKREVELPSWFYGELEAWLFGFEDEQGNWQGWISPTGQRLGWRAVFNPNHDFVFSQKNGKPFSRSTLCNLVRSAVYSLTGQACTPHLVRDMIVTSLMERGVPEHVMEAFAYMMAHSRETQRKSYDRRSQKNKMRPAMEMMAELRKNL
ncbi:MAG: hypothetical protein HY785_18415 [Oscillatoriophycideae cyanobacterium NC_groundwater_1537_Pr4_S-0.65um_50_18]|nr:hypothetical protein [Oscillatoriophycideae cyanobacterium NC_groundwater_1537_Pr4_S-0.65um_50_18]